MQEKGKLFDSLARPISVLGLLMPSVLAGPRLIISSVRLSFGLYDFNRALGLHAVHQSSDRLCLYFRYFRGNTISSAAIDG